MRSAPAISPRRTRPVGALVGVAIFVLGLAWFYVATFVVIPHYSALAYGIGQTPYAARFGELGDSFGDVLRSLVTRPLAVLRIALEPLRLRYLLDCWFPPHFWGCSARKSCRSACRCCGEPVEGPFRSVLRRAALFGPVGPDYHLGRGGRPGPADPQLPVLARGRAGQQAPRVRPFRWRWLW